jgi:sporulation protein YlmC with PRC-barrel domain
VQTGATWLLQLKEIDMKMKTLAAMTAIALLSTAPVAFAQSMEGVDPACIMKDASGADKVDMTKCPDGKTMKMMDGAATTAPADPAAPATDSAATPTPAPAPDAPATDTATTPAPATPDSTMSSEVIVPNESLNGATLITGSDFTGKRVYSKAGDDIGEVNDVLLSQDGKISAVILGVGGFLGIGEKDVLVSMRSIDMQRDGETVKLVVDATKEILTSAPTYDRTKRTYMVN